MSGRILVVDDEKLTRTTLAVALQDEGYEVATAANGYEALEELERSPADVIITDLRMPSMDGLAFQEEARRRSPDSAVIVVTAYASVDTAIQAMRLGADDYLTKPLRSEELLLRVRRLVEERERRRELRGLRRDAGACAGLGDVVYRSAAMKAVLDRIAAVADADVTVLIEGETGVGKEVLARAIHARSGRMRSRFVVVNCAGLSPALVESELFGHLPGAFTGAVRRRAGRFETAAGGTLFIDEVDDIPLAIQGKLLRFLQDRTFEPVGSDQVQTSDARVLCATKRSLPELVRAGRFREDLYYRIGAVGVVLPPLRDRPDDIVPLAEHFAAEWCEARGRPRAEFVDVTLERLLQHDWPGNVRELRHAVEHALAFSAGGALRPEHLPAGLAAAGPRPMLELHLDAEASVPFQELVAECERRLIRWALSRTAGNQLRAAELLHLSRTTLRNKMAALGLIAERGGGTGEE
ncbi:MAG: sigma-54-dependent Fis family transcriptional regulator [Deltaproteobacteria bacterium]|nr:sigma-54-dependent Fis family transcriptional regulator [Deltaproteobacteria bacterium]